MRARGRYLRTLRRERARLRRAGWRGSRSSANAKRRARERWIADLIAEGWRWWRSCFGRVQILESKRRARVMLGAL